MEQELLDIIAEQPYPLLFVTISGSHLYGFASPDSDYDLRGVHILPVREVIGLDAGRETIEIAERRNSGLELDLVTHDIKKFFSLLLKKNGYVLEQLYSPLVLQGSSAYQELKEIASGCITRHHAHHYLGFARTQWRLFAKESPQRAKPLLYVFRVLLTGIYLMRTGSIEANLVKLNEEFRLPYIPELIARKMAGGEGVFLLEADIAFYQGEFDRLYRQLEESSAASSLPEKPNCKKDLNDLLVRSRLF